MKVEAKITCRYLSNYTIYFMILGGRDAELIDGKRVRLSNPEDEEFTAWAWYQRVSFDEIRYLFYELPILEDNGKAYTAMDWWGMLSKVEKRDIKDVYASAIYDNGNELSDKIVRFLYRSFLFDQYEKNIIQLLDWKDALNWWKILPKKSRDQLLLRELKKYWIDYSFDDVQYLYSKCPVEFDELTLASLRWWHALTDDEKLNLIHQHINRYFHITAPDVDDIIKIYNCRIS